MIHLLAFFVASCPCLPQDPLPEKLLQELKDSTAFIRADTGALLEIRDTGSGFLIRKEGKVGYVATSYALVAVPPLTPRHLEIVFRSGQKDEFRCLGVVAGEDADRGLAILRVEHENLPKPLPLTSKAKLTETLPLWIFGFPFGSELSQGTKNPAVTIGKGTLSKVHMGPFNRVSFVQLEGDLNWGQSGAPVVDGTGSLVGIAIAKVRNSKIGLAIPPHDLDEMLLGRVGSDTLEEVENFRGTVEYLATVRLINPLGGAPEVAVAFLRKDRLPPNSKPEPDGLFGPVAPGMSETRLTVEGGVARGRIILQGDPKGPAAFIYQIRMVRTDGRAVYTWPAELEVDFRVGAAKLSSSEALAKRREAAGLGAVTVTGTVLAGEKKAVDGASVTTLAIQAAKITGDGQWSSDAKSVFVLQGDVLLKIDVASLKEERRVGIGVKPSGLHRSAEGLLVLLPDLQEIWILDEAALGLRGRIPVGNVVQMTSAPASSVCFGTTSDAELAVIDLKARAVVNRLKASTLWRDQGVRMRRAPQAGPFWGFQAPAVTPDGKYLFCASIGNLLRFAVNGTTVTVEEMGPDIASQEPKIQISPDSKSVAMITAIGNRAFDGQAPIGTGQSYGTYLFSVGNLQRATGALQSGYWPRCLAWDPVSGKVYAQNHERQLLLFTPQGFKEMEFGLSTRGDNTLQILVHPSGRRLLVRTENRVFWVELPATLASNVRKDDPSSADAGKPTESNAPFLMVKKTVDDAVFTLIESAGENADRFAFSTELVWSEDGKYLYGVSDSGNRGVVRKIAIPELKEERRLIIHNSRCGNLQRSKEGLVVVSFFSQEIWVLDEAKLEVKSKIGVKNVLRVVCVPGSSFAYCETQSDLVVVDLRKGAVLKTYDANAIGREQGGRARRHKDSQPFARFSSVRLTPDGATLLCQHDGCLHRFSVKGAELTLEESGPRIHGITVILSADGKSVVLLHTSGNGPISDHPKLSPGGLYVYRTGNLQQPASTLSPGADCASLGFDKSGGWIYGSNRECDLLAMNSKGEIQKKYVLGPSRVRPNQILVHPQGRKLLYVMGNALYWVEFSK